jgi:hypothetical protein
MKALILAKMPNNRIVYQLTDGTIVEISPNPATKEPSPWHKLLDERIDVFIDLPDGTGLTGKRTKSIGSGINSLILGILIGGALCYLILRVLQ